MQRYSLGCFLTCNPCRSSGEEVFLLPAVAPEKLATRAHITAEMPECSHSKIGLMTRLKSMGQNS
jgi:hypothetical protein